MPTPSSTAAPLDAELVRRLVTEVVRRLTVSGNEPAGRAVAPGPGATAPTPPTAPAGEASATAAGVTLASTVISLAMLEKLPSGTRRVIVSPGAVITPSAREHARDKGLVIDRPDQVWCADITYIHVQRGFLYLVAIMDWATRHVLAWRLSNTMDVRFCL